MSFLKTVRGTDAFAAFAGVVRAAESTYNAQRLLAEASALHESRESRKLYKTVVSASKLSAAYAVDAKARSRMTAIRTDLIRQRALVAQARIVLTNYLRTTFQDELRAVAPTESDRKAVLWRVTRQAEEFEASAETVLTVLATYVEDIDKTGFTLRGMLDLLKMQLDRGGDIGAV